MSILALFDDAPPAARILVIQLVLVKMIHILCGHPPLASRDGQYSVRALALETAGRAVAIAPPEDHPATTDIHSIERSTPRCLARHNLRTFDDDARLPDPQVPRLPGRVLPDGSAQRRGRGRRRRRRRHGRRRRLRGPRAHGGGGHRRRGPRWRSGSHRRWLGWWLSPTGTLATALAWVGDVSGSGWGAPWTPSTIWIAELHAI